MKREFSNILEKQLQAKFSLKHVETKTIVKYGSIGCQTIATMV